MRKMYALFINDKFYKIEINNNEINNEISDRINIIRQ
jgi:hypothetical protein